MSVFKSQFTRAINAYKSDDAIIPNPALFVSSRVNTETHEFQLIDDSAEFISAVKVYPGDVVYNNLTQQSATVVEVQSEITLLLNADIFLYNDEPYSIYNMSPQANIGNTGCNLYIGGAGTVNVVTIGGDVVNFLAVPSGTTLPIQVRQLVASTTATSVLALW